MMIRPSTVEPLSSLGTGYYDAGLSNNGTSIKGSLVRIFFQREPSESSHLRSLYRGLRKSSESEGPWLATFETDTNLKRARRGPWSQLQYALVGNTSLGHRMTRSRL